MQFLAVRTGSRFSFQKMYEDCSICSFREDADEEFHDPIEEKNVESSASGYNISETGCSIAESTSRSNRKEDYERAAKLRDEITKLGGSSN